MTAPSLILLGHGSNDPQVPQVSHQIREGLLAIRPELDIHVAFLDHCTPSGIQVVNKLVSRGVEEIVFVPLLFMVVVAVALSHRARGSAFVDHRSSAP